MSSKQLAIMPLEDYKKTCDKIREKTNTEDLIKSGDLTEKIDEVFEVGKNVEWNEIKGTASGEELCIYDISPIEHEMSVKVSGVDDLISVKVTKYGKNIIDYKKALPRNSAQTVTINEENKSVIWSGDYYFKIPLNFLVQAGTEVVFSCISDKFLCIAIWDSKSETPISAPQNGSNAGNAGVYEKKSSTITANYDFDTVFVYKTSSQNNEKDMVFKEIQLELGSTATEYHDFIQPTEYTPDADGVVQGVTSLYPSTTLMTDIDGVVIEATYNKRLSEIDDIPERIEAVYDEGYIKGEREMWDNITNYNTRIDYEKIFSDSGYEYITPPYKIYPKYKRAANQTFSTAKMLKKIGADYFDFSQKTKGTDNQSAYYYTFYNCSNLEEIEDIGMQADYGYSTTFANCIKLKKIACVRSDENTLYNGEVFNYCYVLEEVRFEGVIGKNGINLRWSTKLSKASWYSIINALSTTTTGLSITGSLASVKKAFETSPGSNDGDTSTEWLELETSRSNWKINLL